MFGSGLWCVCGGYEVFCGVFVEAVPCSVEIAMCSVVCLCRL